VASSSSYCSAEQRRVTLEERPALEFKFLLQPLEPHLAQLEKYVHAVVSYLISVLRRLQTSSNKLAKGTLRERMQVPIPQDEYDTVMESIEESDLSILLVHYQDIIGKLQASFLEDQAYEEKKEEELGHIGTNSIKESTTIGKYTMLGGLTINETAVLMKSNTIVSNKEVIVVNAVLASMKDLMDALRGLVAVLNKMNAHRTIYQLENGIDIR
jgi:hypothetical protein